ncbi:MAG: cation:proton antiporter [Pirellulaceae bacterium]|nr:cation:proton antiporter [Pirellulaceae bacterium]
METFVLEEHQLILYLAGVPLLGILAQWLAWRFHFPSILLLLFFGVTLGAFIHPDRLLQELASADKTFGPQLLFPIVSLSVAVILFEGGLTLRFSELKKAGSIVLRLVTLGAVVCWVLTASVAHWTLQLDWRVAALIGAVLVVTGPTVVTPMLRQIQPSRRMASIVKWEGIVIDPIGAILAVLVFEVVFAGAGHASAGDVAFLLAKTTFIGLLLGSMAAAILVQCVKRFWIPDFLHGVVFLTVALAIFAVSNVLQEESGLVTVTVLGIVLANQKVASIRHVLEFKEHLRVFLISCLFILLGSRLNFGDVLDLGVQGIVFLCLLIVLVRPLSIFVATIGTSLSTKEKVFLGFLAPRGIVAAAVSSVFALRLAGLAAVDEGLARFANQAESLVSVTFLTIAGTVFVYGLFAAPLARWLKVSDPNPQGVLFAGADPSIREIAKALQTSGQQVMLVDTSYTNVAAARMDGLNAECCSILSEHAHEELDFTGIGRLIAATPNDEVNALAVREFLHLFGSANVYQLPPWDRGGGRRESISDHLRGRLVFEESLNHAELRQLWNAGSVVKKTKLTEEFTFAQFKEQHGNEADLLFVMDEASRLMICTVEGTIKPKSGQTLLALVPSNRLDSEKGHLNSDDLAAE